MESLIKAYTADKKVTDYKKIFRCSPEEAYMHTLLASTQYTFCFAAQFAKWVIDVQRTIPLEYHRRGTLNAVIASGNLKFLDTPAREDVLFLMEHYNPIVLWNKLDLTLETSVLFYKMIPNETFFKKAGCLEECVKSHKFEYTLEMDATLTKAQFLILSSALNRENKKLKIVGPNYLGVLPLQTVLATVDFKTTVFISRVKNYRSDLDWKRLEVLGYEIANNDIGPYFEERTKGIVLPNDPGITIGPIKIDVGGSTHSMMKLYDKFGPAIIEQFINYDVSTFAQWFIDIAKDSQYWGMLPSITKFQFPNICPRVYQAIYGFEPHWDAQCHKHMCKECDPEEYVAQMEKYDREAKRRDRLTSW